MNKEENLPISPRPVFLHILTTTIDPERVTQVEEPLKSRFGDANLTFHPFAPYWKINGWGELIVTLCTAQPLETIQNSLADRWKSDTASDGIHLPDVGFLWITE